MLSSTVPSAPNSASPRLTRWEVVGAWLHVWTPPKGVEVPPIPWRKIAIWGSLGVIVLGAAAVYAIPKIDQGKKRGAAERAAEQAALNAKEVARLRADMRVHRLTVAAGADLVAALESAVQADAQARDAAGTIDGPVLSTKCEAATTNVVQFPDSRVYKCFVKTKANVPGEGGDILSTGYPFVATIYTKKRTLAWCKENPHADEKGSHGALRVKVSPVCSGKLSQVL